MTEPSQLSDFVAYWGSLHFETRQEKWEGHKRIFRQLNTRKGRPQVWECWVEGDRYFTRHGLLDGKMQETSKKGKHKNKGRSNELTPEQDALAEARRLCRKRWDFEGYDEFVGDLNIDQRGGKPSVPHLLASLPGSFSMYKPHNNILEAAGLRKKAENREVWYTLKRNGLAFWVVVDSQRQIQFYSRRNRATHKDEGPREREDGTMDYSRCIPWTARFPHLVDAISILNLPPNTMLCCELVHPEGDSKKHFAHVQGVEKSLTPRALELQRADGFLGLYWWDVPFFAGKDLVSTESVEYRFNLIHEKWANEMVDPSTGIAVNQELHWVQPIAIYNNFSSLDDAINKAKEFDLEGWVVVDPKGLYADRAWNMRGKPDRPSKYVAKLKPMYEDDFVALWDPDNGWGTHGKGRHEGGKKVKLPNGAEVTHGGVGSVGLGQYNSKGELVYVSDCASGMEYSFQAQLKAEDFPMVWEVGYNERSYISKGAETNALTFPRFVRFRTDKDPKECVNEEL